MSAAQLELRLGVIADPLKQQLAAQGWQCSDKDCDLWEALRLSLNRLRIHGVLSAAESQRASRRLFKRIGRGIRRAA